MDKNSQAEIHGYKELQAQTGRFAMFFFLFHNSSAELKFQGGKNIFDQ